MPTCENCKREVKAFRIKPFCFLCYGRYEKYGDMNAGPPIKEKLLNPPAILTEQQHNMLIALMLGDGYLRKGYHRKNANLAVARSLVDIEYMKFQMSIFKNMSYNLSPLLYNYYNKETNKTYPGCRMITAALPILTDYHTKWYPKNADGKYVKIVPNDLKLNSEIIANWICDDGSLALTQNNRRIASRFSTDGFTKDEVYFLANLLIERYNEYFGVCCNNRPNGGQTYTISAADAATRAMIEDIKDIFPISMSRKIIWNDIVSNNLPKINNKVLQRKNRTIQILEYLSKIETFTLSKLNDDLKLYNENQKGKTTHRGILSYLKDYIDKGFLIKSQIDENNIAKGFLYTASSLGRAFFLSSLKSTK